MKQQLFNGKYYNIPQNWGEVSVAMLIKAAELSELLDDAPIVTIISAYCGIPVKEIKLSVSAQVQEIIATMAFLTEPYVPQPMTSFTLDGIEYHCEEELVNQKFEDFVSVQTALYNHRDEPARALPRLLAILCKRDGETLDSFNLNERAKLMEALPMTEAKNVECFFLLSLNAYKSLTLLSSTIDIQKELVLAKLVELRNTLKQHKGRSGMFSGMRLRIGIWQLQLWWVKRVLVKYFNLEPTKPSKKTLITTCKNWLMKMPVRSTKDSKNKR